MDTTHSEFHPSSPIPFQAWFQKIENKPASDYLFLTPNKRLSRFIQHQYNRYKSTQQIRAGGGAWPTLHCHSIQGWLQILWQDLVISARHPLSDCLSMSSEQEWIVWQDTINQHPLSPALLNTLSTAKLAMQAWRLIHEWQLNGFEAEDQDSRVFQAWCQGFENKCRQKQLISQVIQTQTLIEELELHHIDTPSSIYRYGFDEFTPQQIALFSILEGQHTIIEDIDLPEKNNHPCRYEFHDENSEIQASARWAKHLIQQQPNASIAIVAPQLIQQRNQFERIFTQQFDPVYAFPDQPQHATGFNMSAGQPLDQVPIIAAALTALHCNRRWIDIESLSKVLLSPFFGVPSELPDRADIDIVLRGQSSEIAYKDLLHETGRHIPNNQNQIRCPDLHTRLCTFHDLSKQGPDKRYPSEWAKLITAQLNALGWPGERTLDTLEYQQIQDWIETLEKFAGLDYVTTRIPLNTALQHLKTLLKQNSFQAKTQTSPIQILGILEAAGLPFDYVWVMSMDDDTWPPAANPNPLIPITLQKQANMPQSSAERELQYALRLNERIARNTTTLIYSHAVYKKDKRVAVSPLFSQLTHSIFPITQSDGLIQKLTKSGNLECLLDTSAPPVSEPQTIQGGTQLFKDQAACPFQAFARHRLHTQDIPITDIGLNALDRGNVIHHTLEILWHQIRDHHRLTTLSQEKLDDIIHHAIERALANILNRPFSGKRFLDIEKQRITGQMQQWLQLEKQRMPFHVRFNESRKQIHICGLPITLRFDRIDQLDDGTLFVLDYKTGQPDIRAWAGERPDEPQIPLYCHALQETVSGAAFGQINAQSIEIKGVSRNNQIAPGLEPPSSVDPQNPSDDWQALTTRWRDVLEALACSFLAGIATVSPKHPTRTCQYCELSSLCRIHDTIAQAHENAE